MAGARHPRLRRHRDERTAVRRRHAVCRIRGAGRRAGRHHPHADPRPQGGRHRGRAHHLPHGDRTARCRRRSRRRRSASPRITRRTMAHWSNRSGFGSRTALPAKPSSTRLPDLPPRGIADARLAFAGPDAAVRMCRRRSLSPLPPRSPRAPSAVSSPILAGTMCSFRCRLRSATRSRRNPPSWRHAHRVRDPAKASSRWRRAPAISMASRCCRIAGRCWCIAAAPRAPYARAGY